MDISGEIIRMVDAAKLTAAEVVQGSHLYTDLGYDSLGFVALLLRIEEAFGVEFELMEMGQCLKVGRIIELVLMKAGGAV